MSIDAKRWDVLIAKVYFDNMTDYKIRPVLYLSTEKDLVACFPMTGTTTRAGEYPLARWKEAGLKKPTAVRIRKKLYVRESNVIKKIGRLNVDDVIAIMALL